MVNNIWKNKVVVLACLLKGRLCFYWRYVGICSIRCIRVVLVVDDNPHITFTFKQAFDGANLVSGNKTFHVDMYNDPLAALLNFKRDFYDLI